MSKTKRFEGRLEEIELEIVDFLVQSPLFAGQSEYLPVIKAFFITRRDLTQKEIKELTGYSTGVISLALTDLVNIGFVEKAHVSKMGKITYSMNSIVLSFMNFYIDGFKQYDGWRDEITGMMAGLEKEKEKLKDQSGYDVIYKYVSMFLRTFTIIQPIVGLMKSKKLELERKDLEKLQNN